LLKVIVVRQSEDERVVIFVHHHIIVDGYSYRVLLTELFTLYSNSLATGQEPDVGLLPPLPVQFLDYLYWQEQHYQGEKLEQVKQFWRAKITPHHRRLRLPTKRPHPKRLTYQGARCEFCLSRSLIRDIEALAKNTRSTVFEVVLAAYHALLSRYAGTPYVNVTTAFAPRFKEIKDVVGYISQNLPVPTDLSGDPSFVQLLAQLRQTLSGIKKYQTFPPGRIYTALYDLEQLNECPLGNLIFFLDDQRLLSKEVNLPGMCISFETHRALTPLVPMDLSLAFSYESAHSLLGFFDYNTDFFDRETIERMAVHLQALMGAALEEPERPLSKLAFLSREEQERLDQARRIHYEGLDFNLRKLGYYMGGLSTASAMKEVCRYKERQKGPA
jgi:hypothetical protein